ncbi:hypothetical protein UFOVP1124_9 [uncultured Caudovirales phage]|uniref:Uncharacterized protein n=1 Tax=uncultured Caudovirales phage TaxID=2100421 RepID=A0A6J5QSS6_9CAUD|nr:hypothetical protein UFOVP1124_9 [uncultured Caudovirales phage]
MLQAIIADPLALPLWLVFAFAASMFPLGLLLPGCACCGSLACTQCGIFPTGDAAGQDQYGRMCCNAGTIPSSVTYRVTNVGPASSVVVTRGTGSPYAKTTKTYPCSSLAGDYVVPIWRTPSAVVSDAMVCWWGDSAALYVETYYGYLSPYSFAIPALSGAWPGWKLRCRVAWNSISWTSRVQSCSGYPGAEGCTVGSTSTAANTLAVDVDLGPFTAQRCSPAGLSLGTLPVVEADYPFLVTGCVVSVEFV